LGIIGEKRRRSITRWSEKHGGKLPCSLMTAAWYLTRLGVFPMPPDRLNDALAPAASNLLNVLPDIYQDNEREVLHLLDEVDPRLRTRITQWDTDTERPWDHLRPQTYFEDNYAEPHEADLHLARELRLAWQEIGVVAMVQQKDLEVIEIGTGANLYPVLAALPYASRLHITDVSQPVLDYLREQASGGLDRRWMKFGSTSIGYKAARLLMTYAEVQRLAIDDLAVADWDVVSMHFVAESITSSKGVFAHAMGRIYDGLAPGGHLLASFMLGSSGWTVAGAGFPAVPLSLRDVQEAAIEAGFELKGLTPITGGETPVREGYDGMCFLHAVAR